MVKLVCSQLSSVQHLRAYDSIVQTHPVTAHSPLAWRGICEGPSPCIFSSLSICSYDHTKCLSSNANIVGNMFSH